MNFFDKILLFTFPFMDVGFYLFGIPLRIGEISFFMFMLRYIDIEKVLKIKKVNRIGVYVFILLVINLLLVVVIKSFTVVDESFYHKYVLRNILYPVAFLSFVVKPVRFEKINITMFIRWILVVVVLFFVLEMIDFYIVGFNLDSMYINKQTKGVFHDFIIRFSGPSNEPAYVIPLLSISLMYGLLSRRLKYSILSIFLILLTFSSFGYVVIVLSAWYFWRLIESKEEKQRAKKIMTKIIAFMSFVFLFFIDKVVTAFVYNWEKFQTYFGLGNVSEWSAMQRSGHISLGLDLFLKSSWYNMLLGNGTGFYSIISKKYINVLDDAEEAHNLYISTLTDRGLFGLILIITIWYFILKLRIPDYVSGNRKHLFYAIKFGVIVKMFHWFFTGMLWQYYFWVEVILLISASIYYIRNEKNEIR